MYGNRKKGRGKAIFTRRICGQAGVQSRHARPDGRKACPPEPILRHRINPSGMKGMTSKNSFNHQERPFQGTMSGNGFEGIVRAAGIKPTLSPQNRGKRQFIDPDQPPQQHAKNITVSVCSVQSASPFGQKGISRLKKSYSTAIPRLSFWQ